MRDMGICEVLSAPHSPWQRAYIERVIGSLQRECLDHVIVFQENSLRRTLHSYFEYYHRSRTHLSLAKDSPEPRAIQPPEMGSIVDWWTTSPLRTTGCVKAPEPTMLRVVSAPPFGIRVRNVLPCTRVSPSESSRSANCVSFGSTRGFTSLVRLYGIFVDSANIVQNHRRIVSLFNSDPCLWNILCLRR